MVGSSFLTSSKNEEEVKNGKEIIGPSHF